LSQLAAHHLPGRRLVVISDEHVSAVVRHDLSVDRLTFPAGEASKTRAEWARLTDAMLALGFGRDAAVVAVGGGVTADLAGFVAATFMRGIPVLQVPTSLLAMLDAALGGKTGLDLPAGKNLVGAFHQPAAVLVDPLVLATLPEPEYRHALAEAVKHAAVADAAHFDWLERHADAVLAREPAEVEQMIRRSLEIKADIVEADEFECGRRAVLNAGHTVAHAIEAASAYRVSHGAAVAVGLVTEARLGERLGLTAPGTATAIAELLQRFGLPTQLPTELAPEDLLAFMRADKKRRDAQLRFTFVARLGAVAGDQRTGWTHVVTEESLLTVLGRR
jgi:3-dehydroquinate synthase